jgi:hypothetical protein
MHNHELSPSGGTEHITQHALHSAPDKDTFRKRAAVALTVLAVLLALSNLGGEVARKETVIEAVRASDLSVSREGAVSRQLDYLLMADLLDALAQQSTSDSNPTGAQRLSALAAQERAIADNPPPSNPASRRPTVLTEGTSVDELAAGIQEAEAASEHAEEQNEYFGLATVLLEIGLVVGSVAILVASRAILGVSLVAGAVAAILGLNALLLVVGFPH